MLPQHETYLRDRAVPPDVWEERGVQSITRENQQPLLDVGFSKRQIKGGWEGLLIPVYDATGSNGRYQFRHIPDCPERPKFDAPANKPGKYLDVHPRNTTRVQDVSVPLWITEGTIKGDAGTAHDLCVVAIPGVTMWNDDEIWEAIPLTGRRVYICFDSDALTKRDVHKNMAAIGEKMTDWGALVSYVYLPAEAGPDGLPVKMGLDDYFAQGHSAAELYTYADTELRALVGAQPAYQCDDIGNAERFVWQHGDAVRYEPGPTPTSGKWFVWHGTHWAEDIGNVEVQDRAQRTARSIAKEAFETRDETRRGQLQKWAKASGQSARIEAILKQARSHARICVSPELWNQNAELLNLKNGTLNLRTGELQPHNPDDHITLCAPIHLNLDATHPMLTRYLDGLQLSAEMRAFLPRLLYAALYGHNQEEIGIFLIGPKRSGKGTITEVLGEILGPYAEILNVESWQNMDNRRKEDFADAREARIIVTDEWPEEGHVNRALYKTITGGGSLKARRLYENYRKIKPKFTPIMTGNYAPKVPADDEGFFRRFLLIHFPAERSDAEQDPAVKDTLLHTVEGREAFFAWIVREGRGYVPGKLGIPDEVRKYTRAYQEKQSPLTDWRREWCVEGKDFREQSSTLYQSWCAWERNRGLEPGTDEKFSVLMTVAGFAKKRTNKGAFWVGIKLKEVTGVTGLAQNGKTSESIPHTSYKDIREPVTPVTFPPTLGEGRFVVGDTPLPIEYIVDAEKASEVLGKLPPGPIPLDIETTGLNPRTESVRLVQIAGNDTIYVIDMAKVPLDRQRLLDGREVLGHNLAFEFGFLPPMRTTRAWDTMLASQVLTMGEYAGNGLDDVAKRMFGIELDKTHQKSNWSGDLTDEQIRYAAEDVRHLRRIMDGQISELRASHLLPTAELEMRALMGIQWMAGKGAPLDWAAWETLAHRKMEEQAVLAEELKQWADINWNSTQQVQKFFGTADAKEETISSCGHPAVELYLSWKSLTKLTSTYGVNWRAFCSNGRVHADWKQIEARTGRMACSDPNLQNIPRYDAEHPHRALFRASEGRVLIKADYSQIELRIAAQLSGDEKLLRAYRNGEDVHSLTAASVLKKPLDSVTKADRQVAKSVNFGLLYGMGGPGLQRYARSNYGVDLSDAEAWQLRYEWQRAYPGIQTWQKLVGWDDPPCDTYTILGRRRKGVPTRTHKLNSPVQGTGADGIKHALALMWENPMDDVFPVMVVHDEIVVEAPESHAEEAKDWAVQCMTDGMAAYVTEVPVEVEAKIGRSWIGD